MMTNIKTTLARAVAVLATIAVAVVFGAVLRQAKATGNDAGTIQGIMANSATQTMLAADTSPDNTVSGYITKESIALSGPSGQAYAWALVKPTCSGSASRLNSATDSSPKFSPDCIGTYTVTLIVTADGSASTYVLRISVVDIGAVSSIGSLRLMPMGASRVPTPATGKVTFLDSDNGNALSTKDEHGNVAVLGSSSATDLRGHAIAATTPSNGQLLGFNGTAWSPVAGTASGDVSGNLDALTVGKVNGQKLGAAPHARAICSSAVTRSGAQTCDGVSLVNGDRALIPDGVYGGLWAIVESGPWARAGDFDTDAKVVPGSTVRISEGTVYRGSVWYLQTPAPITLGVTALTWQPAEARADLRRWGVKCDGTDESAKVQAALSALTTGQTLVVPCLVSVGTAGWTGLHIDSASDVTITGEGRGGFKLLALGTQYDGEPGHVSPYLVRVYEGARVKLDRLEFDLNGLASGGIVLWQGTDNEVRHNYIHGALGENRAPLWFGITAYEGTGTRVVDNNIQGGCFGMWIKDESGDTISGNAVNGTYGDGIFLGVDKTTVSANRVTNTYGGSGIVVGTAGYTISDVAITGNIIEGISGSGIQWDSTGDSSGSNNIVSKNSIREVQYNGINVSKARGLSIDANTLTDVGQRGASPGVVGMAIYDIDVGMISNNVITDTHTPHNTFGGIYVDSGGSGVGPARITISNNKIVGGLEAGIKIGSIAGADVSGNDVSEATYGLAVMPSNTHIRISGNKLRGTTADWYDVSADAKQVGSLAAYDYVGNNDWTTTTTGNTNRVRAQNNETPDVTWYKDCVSKSGDVYTYRVHEDYTAGSLWQFGVAKTGDGDWAFSTSGGISVWARTGTMAQRTTGGPNLRTAAALCLKAYLYTNSVTDLDKSTFAVGWSAAGDATRDTLIGQIGSVSATNYAASVAGTTATSTVAIATGYHTMYLWLSSAQVPLDGGAATDLLYFKVDAEAPIAISGTALHATTSALTPAVVYMAANGASGTVYAGASEIGWYWR